ncbi:MAG TPA: VCBS repeat-containing protein [Verrucomicrobiae bacterium]|nr:VCBS repeat-containing protein [Verrucomicrobiae bacterium]
MRGSAGRAALAPLVALGLLIPRGTAVAQQGGGSNMVNNADMGRAIPVEVLWEGVDSKGNLRVPTGSRITATSSGNVTSVPMPASPSIGDVTGDQLPDLVVGDGLGYIWVFKNSGAKEAPKFTQGEILPMWLYSEERWGGYKIHEPWERDNPRYVPRVFLTDWDGNREPEVVVGTFYGEIFRVPLNISGGRIAVPGSRATEFEINIRQQGEFWGNLFTPCVWDWNGDGLKDLIIGEGTYACNAVYLLLNTGSNSGPRFKAEERKVMVWGDGREQLKPIVIDWDNDGTADLLVCDYKGEITVHLNKGGHKDMKEPLPSEGSPVAVAGQKSIGQLACPALGDLNGDGLPDLVVGKTDGTLHLALNTGKAGAFKFDKIEPIKGADIYPATKKVVYWNDSSLRPGVPYHVVEQFNDPANTAGPNRSGGDCLRLYYVEPKQVVASGKFPEVGAKIKDFKNILRYDGSFKMFVGKKYELTFWVRRSGFQACEWYTWANEWEQEKTRRGEEAQWYGKKLLSSHHKREEITPGNWKQIKYTFTLEGKIKGNEMIHNLWFLTDGKGELYVDDISYREL